MPVESIGTANTNFQSIAPSRGGELNKDSFMKLLITQLKYQDPLNPMEDKEFVAQLAQFSSLEQLWDINANLQSNAALSKSMNNAMVTSLIGRKVTVEGNQMSLDSEKGARGAFVLPSQAKITVQIYGSDGSLVRTLDLGSRNAGQHSFEWDGKNDSGAGLSPGPYSFQVVAQDAKGNAIEATELIEGEVSRVIFRNGTTKIMIGDIEVDPGSILAISS